MSRWPQFRHGLIGPPAIGRDRRRRTRSKSSPAQPRKVVLVGNIGRFSLEFRQDVKALSLQRKRMTDDDLPAGLHHFLCLLGGDLRDRFGNTGNRWLTARPPLP